MGWLILIPLFGAAAMFGLFMLVIYTDGLREPLQVDVKAILRKAWKIIVWIPSVVLMMMLAVVGGYR